VVGVVSQPDRPRGRGRRIHPSPVSERALEANLPLLRPERVGDASVVEALRARAPDLGIVVAFGQFLPRKVRELPSEGYLINGHASLLPRFRGAAPIAHAILAGDAVSGVSVMRVGREMDAGPVALTRELEIGPNENSGELTLRLASLAADAIAAALEEIASRRVVFTPQDESAATLAPKIGKPDARIDWGETAERVRNRVRAMAPVPGAWTELGAGTLRILAARTTSDPVDRPPGAVHCATDGALRIATGAGWLLPLRLQRAGGRILDVAEYARGRPIPDGAQLGVDRA
jgi:methionyl-tRNA formyltransferase